ncbi:MAG: hypothetical protein KGI33_11860 [Thaumarchaeota archaeon]|nr:hypothetical protein [Nitrososphaerota archaeon]
MKYITIFAAILVCSITLTPAFSDDGQDSGGNSQGDNQQGNYNQDDGHFGFGGYSNGTMVFGESNRTIFFDDSNGTGIGQNMSDYVHHRNGLEKKFRDDMHLIQKECMQQARQSGNRTAVMQCRDESKSLHQEYRSFVSQQNSEFKQYRQQLAGQSMITQQQNAQSLYSVFQGAPQAQHGGQDNAPSHQAHGPAHGQPHMAAYLGHRGRPNHARH